MRLCEADTNRLVPRCRQAIEDLISDGMLYTTIDEFVSHNLFKRLDTSLIKHTCRRAARQNDLEYHRQTAHGCLAVHSGLFRTG